MTRNHAVDHLPNRAGLTMLAFDVAGLKPIEAAVRVIAALLFWQQQGEAEPVCQRRPSRAKIIAGGALRASVQSYDERWIRWKSRGQVLQHSQIAGIGSEDRNFFETGGDGKMRPFRQIQPLQQPFPLTSVAREVRHQ